MTETKTQPNLQFRPGAILRLPPLPVSEIDTLRWLVALRYRTSIMLLLVLLTGSLLDVLVADSALGLTAVALLYLGFSVLYDFLLRDKHRGRFVAFVRTFQVPERLVLYSLAIYFSGGVLTPAFLLYSLAIIESITVMDPRGVYRTGALAIVFYCALVVLESYHLVPHMRSYGGSHDFFEIAGPATYAVYTLLVSSLLMLTAYMANRVAHLIKHRNTLISRQLQDLRTLYDIANGLGNMLDEDEVLNHLASTLHETQKASGCIIGMVGKDGRLEVRASAGISDEVLSRLRGVWTATPSLDNLLTKGEPLFVDDMSTQPELKPLSTGPSNRATYVYPIKSEAKVLGAISLWFEDTEPRSAEYHHFISTISSQAGVALERARLVCNAQRMAREMSTLYDVGLRTGSTLSRTEIIRRASDHIERLLDPDAYYIALYDPENELISFERLVEHGEQMPRTTTTLHNGGLTSLIIVSKEPILVQDWLAGGARYEGIVQRSGEQMLSYLGVPMIADNKVIGVLSAQSSTSNVFELQDQSLLSAMAAQTAMALENARLHQMAQDQAKYDSLTRVYNHGHFVELVREAVANSDIDDTQVALIMLDIDYFKQYNDSYGHVAGDNVLRMVANALKSNVRESDYVGRWGGEEFGVLLLRSGITEAKRVARQIRRAVSELYPVDAHGHLIANPAISQGISSYPFPSATASALIDQADAALYHAKKHGRNQLIVYEASGAMTEATLTTGDLLRGKSKPTRRNGRGTDLLPGETRRVTTDTLVEREPQSAAPAMRQSRAE